MVGYFAAASLALAPVMVRRVSFEQLVRHSDAIVVARVLEVREFTLTPPEAPAPGVLFGRIRIGVAQPEQWLKGTPTAAPLVFVNQSTWTCDVTGLELGQRALIFFERASSEDELVPRICDYRERFGEEPLHYVAHSGRGQMPLGVVDGREFARVFGDIRFPPDLPAQMDSSESSTYSGPLDFGWLRHAVERCVLQQRETWWTARADFGGDGAPWDLLVRGNRTARLVVRSIHGERVYEWTVDSAATRQIEDRLDALAPRGGRLTFGAPVDGRWAREWSVRDLDQPLELRVGGSSEVPEHIRLLWSELRATFDAADAMRFEHDGSTPGR